MGSIKGWYYGWKATIKIHLFDRETLRRLKEPSGIGDFTEAESPEQVLQRHEKQTLESYLVWLESLADKTCSHCGARVHKEIGLWRAIDTGKFLCPDGAGHYVGVIGGELE